MLNTTTTTEYSHTHTQTYKYPYTHTLITISSTATHFTFQTILFKSGRIVFNYKDVSSVLILYIYTFSDVSQYFISGSYVPIQDPFLLTDAIPILHF